jgi:nucleoside-diphosphate-sugar epimerase
LIRILVTGASGFVGRVVCTRGVDQGYRVVAASRCPAPLQGGHSIQVDSVGPHTDWQDALVGVETVIHLAARVHVMRDRAAEPLAAFRQTNVEGTVTLARQAVNAGVRRLVFVSSIKVNGEATTGAPYSEADPPAPQDPYGQSKLEAELALAALQATSLLEVVVVRPVLVVGPGVGGNLRRLLSLLARRVPLPLGGIVNRRNLIGVDNLADLLLLAAVHPKAAGQLFLAADEPALSTPSLVWQLADGLGKPARLLTLPPALRAAITRIPGAGGAMQRLCGSLEVDSGKARRLLDWRPAERLDDCIRRTAAAFAMAIGVRPHA